MSSSKSNGVSFKMWAEEVMRLINHHPQECKKQPTDKNLRDWYEMDLIYEEALEKAHIANALQLVYMEIHYKTTLGTRSRQFYSKQHADAFFTKFPELRKAALNGNKN